MSKYRDEPAEALDGLPAADFRPSGPTLRVKRLHPDAVLPKYQTPGAAAFDLHSVESGPINGARTFSTGLAYEVPEGFVMLIYSRSGHGFKHDVRLANCTGVIDSDYRGEMFVRLAEDAGPAPDVQKGDRIAQALLVKVEQWKIVEVSELSSTERGEGRFGSTGR